MNGDQQRLTSDFNEVLENQPVFRQRPGGTGLAQESTPADSLRERVLSNPHSGLKGCKKRSGQLLKDLEKMKMKTNKHAPIVTWLTAAALLFSTCASLTFSQRSSAQANEERL